MAFFAGHFVPNPVLIHSTGSKDMCHSLPSHTRYNAYFEVISYTKIWTDAKKRNAVLFDKLGLPSRINLKETTAAPANAQE